MWDDLVDCPQLEFDIGTTTILPKFGKCLRIIIEGVYIIHGEVYGQLWVHSGAKLAAGSVRMVPIRWSTGQHTRLLLLIKFNEPVNVDGPASTTRPFSANATQFMKYPVRAALSVFASSGPHASITPRMPT